MIPKKQKVEYITVKIKVNQNWKQEFENYCTWLNGDKDLDYFFNHAGREELDTNAAWKKYKKALEKNQSEKIAEPA